MGRELNPGKGDSFPCGSTGKESTCNAGDLGSIPGLGRTPGEGKGYPLQYSGLEIFHGLYRPWGHKESDMTEPLSLLVLPQVKLEKQGGEEESGGYPWAREWLGMTPQLHSGRATPADKLVHSQTRRLA